jgi:hypothetical protein
MAKTLEELAKEIYKEALEDGEKVTEEEALEMAKMEMGAKDVKNYTQSEPTEKKPRKPKERKVDADKGFILTSIRGYLERLLEFEQGEGAEVEMETETCLHFDYKGNRYTLKLTKHRPPK